MRKQLFELGELVQTAGVDEKRKKEPLFDFFCSASLARFQTKDWGDLCDEDKQANEEALKNGERLMGVYIFDKDEISRGSERYIMGEKCHELRFTPKKTEDKDPDGLKIYIITEADRSHTTVLFPEEY